MPTSSTRSEISVRLLSPNSDEGRKLTYLLARSRIGADERASQFQGAHSLFLAESVDQQLQSTPHYRHTTGKEEAVRRALRQRVLFESPPMDYTRHRVR